MVGRAHGDRATVDDEPTLVPPGPERRKLTVVRSTISVVGIAN
jgi:hypothetical protein